jgi:hypothetical protein
MSTAAPALRASPLIPLRPYQVEAARAIVRSVVKGLGRTITVEVARQGGKNELSSQVGLYLLTRALARHEEAVKTAPTFRPQLRVSMRRLWMQIVRARLRPIAREEGNAIHVGHARMLFLSADPAANVVGHTASLLLEVDEAQDVDIDKFDREFRPMAATSNATTVLYGTAWHDATLLERAIQANLDAERRDGERRHFAYDWTVVGAHNERYRAFVESERLRLGETHPAYLTQYLLKTISGGGRMFTAAQRAQMAGWHERLRAPVAGETYVAGLDLAGGDANAPAGDEAPAGPTTIPAARAHDSSVLTVGRLVFPDASAPVQEPRVDIVEHYAWTAEPHERLIPQVIDLLRDVWRVRRVAIDASGLGETAARLIAQALGDARVDAVKFTADTKSKLGFELLAAVNGGRLKAYRGDGSRDSAELHRQCELARAEYRAGTTMAWRVAEHDGHDDYLVSAALLVRASVAQQRRIATGRVRA